ncbi:MAG: entry exclusion 1 domain-containing protein [Alphaproteobacteria bacterium]|nr:entry exclusion 1 domain-containing protein [Alphaproteobacteria bacterium]
MAKVGAQRAGELTGKSKSTIQRAMKTGKLSYDLDANGRKVIDVSELDRAFGLLPQEGERQERQSVEAELEKAAHMLETERMRMQIKMLEEQLSVAREQIEDLKEQREQWQKQAQQVLLTSQYSQKQAEELKEELKERERRALLRRQKEMERRAQLQNAGNENRRTGPMARQREAEKSFRVRDLWSKIRGQAASAEAQKTA